MSQQNIQPTQEVQQVDNLIDIHEEDMELEERWVDKTSEERRQRMMEDPNRRGRTVDERLQGINPEGGTTLADIPPRYPTTEERARDESRGRKEGKNTGARERDPETVERQLRERERNRRDEEERNPVDKKGWEESRKKYEEITRKREEEEKQRRERRRETRERDVRETRMKEKNDDVIDRWGR